MFEKNKCLICSSKTFEFPFSFENSISSDTQFFSKQIIHHYCNYCGYIFIDPEKRLDYDSFYKLDYDFLLEGEIEPVLESKKYSDYLVDFYEPFINDKPEKKFFDIGAGKGNLLEAFFAKFPKLHYTALEPSKAYNLLKKKKFISKTFNSFYNSNNFKDKFDYLSLIGVLEHVSDPKLFLLDIKKIMHEESLLLIEVPNFSNNKADLLTIDHLSKFTEGSLTNLFNKTGFKIIKKQISSTVPMQYILKKSDIKDLKKIHIKINIKKAAEYIKYVFKDVEKIKNDQLAVYGQGLIMEYLFGSEILDVNKISCIIDDNILYHNKLWKNKIPIVDFNTFKKKYKTKKILLGMNDCYHHKVVNKLQLYEIFGVKL